MTQKHNNCQLFPVKRYVMSNLLKNLLLHGILVSEVLTLCHSLRGRFGFLFAFPDIATPPLKLLLEDFQANEPVLY